MKALIQKLKQAASAGGAVALATTAPSNDATAKEKLTPIVETITVGSPVVLAPADEFEAEETIPGRRLDEYDGWDEAAQERYHELAIKEALDTITTDEAQELERLEVYREQKIAPITFEEIVRYQEVRATTKQLVEALTRYVTLYDPKRGAYRPERSS